MLQRRAESNPKVYANKWVILFFYAKKTYKIVKAGFFKCQKLNLISPTK
jgi:hypothetical protein